MWFTQLPITVQYLFIGSVTALLFIAVVALFVLPLVTVIRGGKVKVDAKNREVELVGDPDDAPEIK